MSIMLKLFFEFFKVGLFAVGGGAATIPFLSSMSEATGWFTKTDLANMIAISESTPGAIGVNMSAYVGFLTGETVGLPRLGCIVSSIGLITPSIIIILIVSGILNRFKDSILVKNVFYGLRPASTGLIAAAAFEIIKISLVHTDVFFKTHNFADLFDLRSIALFILLFIGIKKFKLHPVVFIAVAAFIGVIIRL
ncbi:MAG: chromate transporter [Clostridia bacterium]|nr:chromate transporter [Clostridia bacterium]